MLSHWVIHQPNSGVQMPWYTVSALSTFSSYNYFGVVWPPPTHPPTRANTRSLSAGLPGLRCPGFLTRFHQAMRQAAALFDPQHYQERISRPTHTNPLCKLVVILRAANRTRGHCRGFNIWQTAGTAMVKCARVTFTTATKHKPTGFCRWNAPNENTSVPPFKK